MTHFKPKHLAWKRIFDLLFSLLVIVFLLPFFIFLAVLVMLSTKSSPIYKQTRVGRGGKLFNCYKFRSMVPNAEDVLKNLLERDEKIRLEWEETRKLKNDPRITPIGKFLRKTSLDELPQFFNVIKGDLSVVGPRAVVMEEIEVHFKEAADEILQIRPGITGLWQVSGRSDVSYTKRIELDRRYVDDVSLKLDMKIVAKTIPIIFNMKGAY